MNENAKEYIVYLSNQWEITESSGTREQIVTEML